MIWNSGKLPEDLSISMLKTKHPSRLYNKNIAEIFFKTGYIEAWGRGIAKMINACKAMDFPEPVITEYVGGIQVVFNKKNLKSSLKNEEKIIALLTQKPSITIPELSKALDKSVASVKKYLQELKKEHKIIRKGPKRGGYWEVS